MFARHKEYKEVKKIKVVHQIMMNLERNANG